MTLIFSIVTKVRIVFYYHDLSLQSYSTVNISKNKILLFSTLLLGPVTMTLLTDNDDTQFVNRIKRLLNYIALEVEGFLGCIDTHFGSSYQNLLQTCNFAALRSCNNNYFSCPIFLWNFFILIQVLILLNKFSTF